MRAPRLLLVVAASAVAGVVTFAQIGRPGSQWLTALGNAQRTSWVRTDDRISLPAMGKPGFELQWKVALDTSSSGGHGLGQGVTATGVTLFVPMTLVTGSSNVVYGVDTDTGYVVWKRQFEGAPPAASADCSAGPSSAATRIVPLKETSVTRPSFGDAGGGYRGLLGQPGEGVPVEGSAGLPPRSTEAAASAKPGADAASAPKPQPPPPPAPAQNVEDPDRIPGAPRKVEPKSDIEQMAESYGFGFLFRPAGVGYAIAADGALHVLGLSSGKDLQRPAAFLPPNARWSSPVAVGTTLYAATVGGCGGAPHAIWAIDLDSDTKRVVSWKTDGGPIVGAIAFTSNGTLIAAVGAGQTSGDGKANAIVALDPKTLQVKDWFSGEGAEFVTGPTVLEHKDKEIVAAASKDGRVWLLDAGSLGGADHATPLHVSTAVLAKGARVSADALAAWRQLPPPAPSVRGARPAPPQTPDGPGWILVPVAGRPAVTGSATGREISRGTVVALKVTDAGGGLALAPAWMSDDLATPATPIIVNGVVFTLATGAAASASARDTPAVLHAYDGATGARLWTSGRSMATAAAPGSFWTGFGQVYVGGRDGTLYAFGFDDERRHTGAPAPPAR